MKNDKTNTKHSNIEDILSEFKYFEAEPSKTFENNLKNQFIAASLPKNKSIFKYSIKRGALFFSVLITVTIFTLTGIGLHRSNNMRVVAQTFGKVYSVSSQSALMPVFAKLKNLSSNDLEKAMNISEIPLQKGNYGTSTTTTFHYGLAYDECADLFKFDKGISKTITFEFYKNDVYKFKTHVFDTKNNEIDLLISDGEKYFSQKQDKTLGSGVANFSNIDSLVPSDLYQTATNEIVWEDQISCGEENKTLNNIMIFNSENKIKSFEINIKDSMESIYKASFEIQQMTDEELLLVDQMFKVVDRN